jgi:hypothetical protein
MMISGHQTRSVFERYNIVSDEDLRSAAKKQESYLGAQTVTRTVTMASLERKRAQTKTAEPVNFPGAGGENRTRMSLRPLDFESSASTCFTTPAEVSGL